MSSLNIKKLILLFIMKNEQTLLLINSLSFQSLHYQVANIYKGIRKLQFEVFISFALDNGFVHVPQTRDRVKGIWTVHRLGSIVRHGSNGARSFAIRPPLLSTHLQSPSFAIILTCCLLTCNQPHLLSASLVIPLFAINSLSVSLALGLTCFRPTCYQNVCSPVSTAINAHLLSKTSYYRNTLLLKLVVSYISFCQKPVIICYHKQLLLSKQVAVKTSSYLLL